MTVQTPGPRPDTPEKAPAAIQVSERATASPAEVVQFFDDALRARGWQRDLAAPGPGIGQAAAAAWRKKHHVFAVSIVRGGAGAVVVMTTLE